MKKLAGAALALLVAGSTLFSGIGTAAARADDAFAVKTSILNETQDKVRIVMAVPEFSGFKEADALNRQTNLQIQNDIATLKEDAKELPAGSAVQELYYSSVYDYSRRGDLLSVWVSYDEFQGGAHGTHGIAGYTLNTKTGEFYNRPDFLFNDKVAGTKWLTEQICKKIAAQSDLYFANAQQTVKDANGNFSYYLDGDKLVVYFGLYEIAPYAGGIRTFEFPLSSVPANLPLAVKPTGSASLGAARLNAATITLKNKVVANDDGVYLPLEETASLLGKSAAQSNGVWSMDGKILATKAFNGVVYAQLDGYMPADTPAMGGSNSVVIYDGEVLRLFSSGSKYVLPSGGAASFLSDTNTNINVDRAYTFRITSASDDAPSFAVGTKNVFEVKLVSKVGRDYYYRITPMTGPGSSAGIYVNGGKRLLVATVSSLYRGVTCDTTTPLSVKAGSSYVFKLTGQTHPQPTFTAGTPGVFRVTFVRQGGSNYYYKITAVGKPGQSSGFYINGVPKAVTAATIVK